MGKEDLNKIDPEDIESIEVFKGEPNAIFVTLKNQKNTSKLDNTLIVVDGAVQCKGKAAMDEIDPNDIESIDVLKGESGIAKYGEKGKDGVVSITLKKM